MQECPGCKKPLKRVTESTISFHGLVVSLTTCPACGAVIRGDADVIDGRLELRLRKIEDRVTAIETKMAGN